MNKKLKQKVRILSIKYKIMIPVMIAVIIGCVLIGYSSVKSYNDEYRDLAITKAEAASNIVVSNLIGDNLKGVLDPAMAPRFQEKVNWLKDIAKYCDLKEIYTLHRDDKGLLYYGFTTGDDASRISTRYTTGVDLELITTAFQGNTTQNDVINYTDNGEKLLSVYQPLFASDGSVAAVVCSVYDASGILDVRVNMISKLIVELALVLTIVSIVVYLIIDTMVSNVLKVNTKIYEIVSNEGDLTQIIENHSGDETELIANNVNKLLKYIRSIMLDIKEDSFNLMAAADLVEEKVERSERQTEDVSATMEQMSAAMEETKASVSQINDLINDLLETSKTVEKYASEKEKQSRAVVEKASDIGSQADVEIELAKNMSAELTVKVRETLEQSKAVEKITSLTENILNISDQTNLLSLNASIEAARAGTAGRGFAVVAGEIGKLATTSAEAAIEIQKVSSDVVDAVSQLAEQTEKMLVFLDEIAMKGYDGLKTTGEEYKADVSKMGEQMLEFQESATNMTQVISGIVDNMNAINLAIEESAIGVANVADVTMEMAADINEIRECASKTNAVADELQVEVNKFKLE